MGPAEDAACADITTALPSWDLSFFSSMLKFVFGAEELLMFIRPDMSDELSTPEGGTLKPVGFAIPSAKGSDTLPLTADNL